MTSHSLAVALIGLLGFTAAHASLKSEIEALNKPIEAAFMKRDVNGFKRIVRNHVTSDFIYTEGDTTMNFDQMVGRIRQGYANYAKVTNVSIRLLSVREKGATGTARERQFLEGIVRAPNGKTHRTTCVTVSSEIYRKVKGEWRTARMSVMVEKMTEDGKPVPLGGPKHPR